MNKAVIATRPMCLNGVDRENFTLFAFRNDNDDDDDDNNNNNNSSNMRVNRRFTLVLAF